MELGAAFGRVPHEVARWPWKRVQRYWSSWRRKQRREERIQLLFAHQSGLGAMAGMFGGGGGETLAEKPPVDPAAKLAAMGYPVTVRKAEG